MQDRKRRKPSETKPNQCKTYIVPAFLDPYKRMKIHSHPKFVTRPNETPKEKWQISLCGLRKAAKVLQEKQLRALPYGKNRRLLYIIAA